MIPAEPHEKWKGECASIIDWPKGTVKRTNYILKRRIVQIIEKIKKKKRFVTTFSPVQVSNKCRKT